jgi:hypothetical protein
MHRARMLHARSRKKARHVTACTRHALMNGTCNMHNMQLAMSDT